MINTFYLDEESAEAYGIIMLAPPDHVVAERDIERKEVPGRSGDVIIDNGRYKNVTVKYSCAILPEDGVPYRTTVARAVQFLKSGPTYKQLRNTYDPDRFDKWEAAYTKTDTATVQNGLWQYSSKNALGIAGFGNSLDCDVCYRDYPAIMEKNGLNGYTKTAQAAQPKATEYMVTAGPMSAGDKNTIKAQAEALGLPVTVKEC